MKTPFRLDAALKRLSAALDQLEVAAERRARDDANRGDLTEELAIMQDDRSRLAVELDAALARAKGLESANQGVSDRLEKAAATIRAVLGEADG